MLNLMQLIVSKKHQLTFLTWDVNLSWNVTKECRPQVSYMWPMWMWPIWSVADMDIFCGRYEIFVADRVCGRYRRNSLSAVRCRAYSAPPGSASRLTHAVTNSCHAPSINIHLAHTRVCFSMGQLELSSALLTIHCHSGLCFHGHPR